MAKHLKARKHPKKEVAPVLAKPGDPLVMSDGAIVYEEPEEGSLQEAAKNNKRLNPRTFRASRRRSAKDLPGEVNIIKAVACVILFSVMGVGDREIADALKITPHELKKVRAHSAYPECFNAMVGEFINANSDLINARLAAYAGDAVDNIMDIATTSKKDEVKLRANIDLADRAGINPKEAATRNSLHINDLHIQIIKKADENVDITVNADV